MKFIKVTVPTLLIAVFYSQSIMAQDPGKAVAYMQSITTPLNSLRNDTWQYLRAVTHGKGVRKVEKTRQSLIKEVKEVKTTISQIGELSTDEGYRKAILDYVDISYKVLNEDFDKILDMEEIAEQSYDLMEAYLLAREQADDKMNAAFESVKVAEKQFAASHKINLMEAEEDKLSKNISNAGELLKYYNDLYLIFFKPYKQEAYLLDAQNRNDVSGIQQNINSLITITNESMGKLKAIDTYKGDGSLKLATQKILNFYKEESEKIFPGVVDFYIKKDNYEKVLNTFNAISERDRTQQDVDQYNKAINEYNDAVNTFNANNETNNRKRIELLNEWNKSVDVFFNAYSN